MINFVVYAKQNKKLYRKIKKGLKKPKLKKVKTTVPRISATKPPKEEKGNFKRGGVLRNSFKKAKEKIKGLKIKSPKKVIGSKKLSILLTAITMVTILRCSI